MAGPAGRAHRPAAVVRRCLAVDRPAGERRNFRHRAGHRQHAQRGRRDDRRGDGAVRIAVLQPAQAFRAAHDVVAAGDRRQPGFGVTPVSMTATGTPLPVEYCHAAAIPSMSNPGASWATSGLMTVIGTLQEFERRIG